MTVRFLKKNLPQVAKLPGTSDLFKEKSQIFEKQFCPRQRGCPGQVACTTKQRLLGESYAPGSEAAWDTWLLQKKYFLERICPRQRSCPGFLQQMSISGKVLPQTAKLPGTSGFFKNKSIFWRKFCPRQRSCPGQVASSKKVKLLPKVLPQAAKLPGTNGLLKKNDFLEKVLPQAAKLPVTSGFFKKR